MNMWDEMAKVRRHAEAALPHVVLEERAHYSSRPGYKCYAVFLVGEPVGTVENADETIERKPRGSRIVTRRWTRKSWVYSGGIGIWSRGLHFETRKRAVLELLEHLARDGKLPVIAVPGKKIERRSPRSRSSGKPGSRASRGE
jgi:hypothetical protein